MQSELKIEKMPYRHIEGRTFKSYMAEYASTVLSQAKDWIEDVYRKRMFTSRGVNVARIPYPNYNSDLIGNLRIVTTKGSFIVLRFGSDEFKFKATQANFDSVLSKATELLKWEIEARETATQEYFNKTLGLSLI